MEHDARTLGSVILVRVEVLFDVWLDSKLREEIIRYIFIFGSSSPPGRASLLNSCTRGRMAACVARYAKSVCRSRFTLGGLDQKNLFSTPLVRVPFLLTESAPRLLRFFENLLFVRSIRFPPFDVVEYPSRITNQP